MNKCYIINTETTEWPIYEGDFRLMFSDTSFPSPLIDLPAPFAWVNDVDMPNYDALREGVEEQNPHNENGLWFRTWIIYNLSPEQIAENENAQKQINKAKAMQLLAETDWSATVDISNLEQADPYLVNQTEFLSYRSNVRKIAVNPPIVVDVWPVKPDEQWSGV